MKWPFVFLQPILFAGCAILEPIYYGTYGIELTQVERPADTNTRYGATKITRIVEEGISKYSFEDSLAHIVWRVTADTISFLLENKTDYSIRIPWDGAVFVDEKGISHRVIHKGIRENGREGSQPPSVVVPKSRIEDNIIPADYISFEQGSNRGIWTVKPFFEFYQIHGTKASVERLLSSNLGKTIQVLLPLQIEAAANEYIFRFKITSYEYKGLYN
jgi:hypothetical protein